MALRVLLLFVRRQLTRNLFRTGVSVSAVSAGVIITVAVNAVMGGFETKFVRRTVETAPHVTVFTERSAEGPAFDEKLGRSLGGVVDAGPVPPETEKKELQHPDQLLQALRGMSGVRAAALNAVGNAILSVGARETGGEIIGILPEQERFVVDIDRDLESGTVLDLYSEPGAVLLGRGLADKLGVEAGDSVSARSETGAGMSLTVAGIFKTGITFVDNRRAYTLLTVAQQLLGLGPAVNRAVVRLDDHDQADLAALQIARMTGYRAESWQESNQHVLSMLATNKVLTKIASAGVMIVAATGILNVLMMIVMERLDEIAILKSMGWTAGDVRRGFLLMGAATGLLGVLLGCSLGYYVVEAIGMIPIPRLAMLETEHLLVENAPRHYLLASGLALAVSVLAAVVPAWRAGSLDPVARLRGR